ncbi:MAG: phenylalanine--tRNA ligase subunit beta [Rhodothermales bacterium]
MNISVDWLKEYVDIDVTPSDLAVRLTLLGFEVDDVAEIGPRSLDGVVIGKVLEVRQHPNADRLVLCDVDLGDGEPAQIVCGAPNVAAGQFVPVALPGSVLHLPDRNDPTRRVAVKLAKSKIRGQVSNGMICAEDELGLSDDHSGIMVLADSAPIGRPLTEYLGDRAVGDTVFDIELTPNRPDATCHIGIAREIAAFYGRSLRLPADSRLLEPRSTARVRVDIENPDGCGRYVGILVTGVKVADSPDWMARRLNAIGLRPRNNIVDITNYVMYELGQPLHAFDYDRLSEGRIVVRNAVDDMRFTTLDDVERRLDGEMLMICDGAGEVAIAGVMGGENSEVTEETVNVLIESAWFDPASIRRTARALGLQTDASYRFERGVDPNGALRAAARAASLMVAFGGGKIEEVVDANPRPQTPQQIELRSSRIPRILGIDMEPAEAASLLSAIGIESKVQGDRLACTIPTFRPDIEREIDLIEEVARRFGFENIPAPHGTEIPYSASKKDPIIDQRSEMLRFLSGLGFREIYTNSLVSPATAERYARLLDPEGEPVATHNAISHEMSALRTSLLPGGLQILAHNLRHGFPDVRLVEFGHVFHRGSESDDQRPSWVRGYVERESILLMVSGASELRAWDKPGRAADLFDLKGIVDALGATLGHLAFAYRASDRDAGIASEQLEVWIDDVRVGVVGEVSASLLAEFDVEQPVFFAELQWPDLAKKAVGQATKEYVPVARYPAVERDLALIVDRSVPAASLLDTVRAAAGSLLDAVDVFDVYEGPEIGDGKRSIAISLSFRADRTLVDKEVDREIERVVESVSRDWNARLRAK